MAYTALHGPPDIDAKHAWAPAAGAAPPVINDRQTDPPTLPWIKLHGIDGWGDLPEVQDNSEPVTYGVGELDYPVTILGKTVVYRWEARSVTREEIRALEMGLRQGYGRSLDVLGTMTVTPYAAPGGVVWTLQGRVLQFTRDATFTHKPKLRAPYRWGGTISIRMLHPYFSTGGNEYL